VRFDGRTKSHPFVILALRWVFRTGKCIHELEQMPATEVKAAFFTSMNQLISHAERIRRLFRAVTNNPTIFFGLEKSIGDLISNNAHRYFDLTQIIASLLSEMSPTNHSLFISADESRLR